MGSTRPEWLGNWGTTWISGRSPGRNSKWAESPAGLQSGGWSLSERWMGRGRGCLVGRAVTEPGTGRPQVGEARAELAWEPRRSVGLCAVHPPDVWPRRPPQASPVTRPSICTSAGTTLSPTILPVCPAPGTCPGIVMVRRPLDPGPTPDKISSWPFPRHHSQEFTYT